MPPRTDTPSPFATTNAELLSIAAATAPARAERDRLYCQDCLATHHLRSAGHDGPHGARPSPLGVATVHGWESSVGPLNSGGQPRYREDADPYSPYYTGAAGVGPTRGVR